MTPASLRQKRLDLGWTQKRLGEALGLTRRTVIYYETGEHKIPHAVALAVEGLVRTYRPGLEHADHVSNARPDTSQNDV